MNLVSAKDYLKHLFQEINYVPKVSAPKNVKGLIKSLEKFPILKTLVPLLANTLDEEDDFEEWNRIIFKFNKEQKESNQFIDGYLLEKVQDLDKVLNRLGFATEDKQIIIGTQRLEAPNAYALKIPETDEYLIIYNQQLWHFLNLISKVAAQFQVLKVHHMKFTQIEILEKRKIAFDRFKDAVYNSLVINSAENSGQYFPKKDILSTHSETLVLAEIFFIGHEMGHILGNHLEDGAQSRPDTKHNEDEKNVRWDKEYEADVMALIFMLEFCKHYINPRLYLNYYYASEFALICVQIIEEWQTLKHGNQPKKSVGGTHPPAVLRIKNIREAFTKMYSGKRIDVKPIVNLASQDMEYFHDQWQIVKKELLNELKT